MAGVILVGTDGSEGGRRAVEFAVKQAKCSDSSVVVACVIEWSPYSFMTNEELAERHKLHDEELARARSQVLDPLIASLKKQGVEARGIARHGHAAEVLNQIAREEKASQIFVGRQGQSKLKAMIFGSIAGSLLQMCPVPVTVVP